MDEHFPAHRLLANSETLIISYLAPVDEPQNKGGTLKAASPGVEASVAEDNTEHHRGAFVDRSRQKANAPAKSLNTAHIFSVYSLGLPLNLICWHGCFFFSSFSLGELNKSLKSSKRNAASTLREHG